MAIVCTSDGSTRSLRALPHAARLARVTGDRLVVLQVVDDASAVGSAEAELRSALDAAESNGAVIVQARSGNESVSDTVCRLAREAGGSVLAMDTRGAGAIRRAILGSVAVSVLEGWTGPMLITGPEIQDPPSDGGPYRIALTDGGGPQGLARVRKMGELLKLPGTSGLVLGISIPTLDEPPTAVADLEAECFAAAKELDPTGRMEVRVERTKEYEKLETAIVRGAMAAKVDAIAMVTSHASKMRHLLVGSASLATVNHSPVPVFIMRDDA